MYNLVNIFEVFLPQLLSYPNPTDPLNPEAAAMLIKQEEKYKTRVKDYVLKYAGGGILKSPELAKTKSDPGSVTIAPLKLT